MKRNAQSLYLSLAALLWILLLNNAVAHAPRSSKKIYGLLSSLDTNDQTVNTQMAVQDSTVGQTPKTIITGPAITPHDTPIKPQPTPTAGGSVPPPAPTAPRSTPAGAQPARSTTVEVSAADERALNASRLPAPSVSHANEVPSIEFQFENTDLTVLVGQIAEIFGVSFLADEMINPLPQGTRAIKGNKVSFKTHKPLTKQEAWNLFLTFLDLAGFAVVPQADPKIYKIMPVEASYRSSIRAYIGVDPATLPDNDEVIRYVYFIENSSLDAIRGIVESLRSSTAPFIILQESKAFILTDKAYNVKMLMQVVKELDRTTMPQILSVLKLRHVDAQLVKELYDTVTKADDSLSARLFQSRKQPSSLYFPEGTRIFAEPRTNTLIMLGSKEAITKIESFITKNIDVPLDKPYSPLKVYNLRYADAVTIAEIMNRVTDFGRATPAGRSGGLRGEDKYLKPMTFIPEKETNRVVIRGDYEDYLRAVEIIKALDEPQPQVAIEVLIVSINMDDRRELGTQLRTRVQPGGNGGTIFGNDVNFQTTGLFRGQPTAGGVIENPTGPGVTRLLGNLIALVAGAPAGNTVVSLGTDVFGVWGVFQTLQTITNAQVVSNPFLTATNKTPAQVYLGEVRRVITNVVVGGDTNQNSFGDDPAKLQVNITPQINSDGMILLNIVINIDQFTDTANFQSGTKQTRNITTSTIVADREVLALGGLIRNRIQETTNKVPILGDIPILGWLFKNKRKIQIKDNLLILVSAHIVKPDEISSPDNQYHIKEYREDLKDLHEAPELHDPVYHMFFAARETSAERIADDFIFKRHGKEPLKLDTREMSRAERRKIARRQKKLDREQREQQYDHKLGHHHRVKIAENIAPQIPPTLPDVAQPVPIAPVPALRSLGEVGAPAPIVPLPPPPAVVPAGTPIVAPPTTIVQRTPKKSLVDYDPSDTSRAS